MSAIDDHYFEELSPFDEAVESFKEELRGSVKKEITDQIERLQTENREQREKLKNLGVLEAETRAAKNAYEYKLSNAERDARRAVEKEGLRSLLAVLAEPRYTLKVAYSKLPKCESCNENRELEYTTPRGKAAVERCECSTSTSYYEVDEQYVHEVAKRSGKLVVWYSGTKQHLNDREDYFSHSSVLKTPEGVALTDLMDQPREYGYATAEAAQVVADALNGQDKK